MTKKKEAECRKKNCNGLQVAECPICFHPLAIPIFQCDNGHIACSTCCEKLSQKCTTCSLPTLSRNRAMERVLELLRVPCPNAGCSETFSFVETTVQHVKHCPFTRRTCPFTSCDFTCSFKDLYNHSVVKHCKSYGMFECGTPVFIYPLSGERYILKEQTTDGEGEVVVVECFDTPQGRLFYACCIGPGTDMFSYELKIHSSSGDRCLFESKLKRVREEPVNMLCWFIRPCALTTNFIYASTGRLIRIMKKLYFFPHEPQ